MKLISVSKAVVLLLFAVVIIEFSYALAVQKKVSDISKSIAESLIQKGAYSVAELDSFSEIAQKQMLPFQNEVNIAILHLVVRNEQAIVQWSYSPDQTKRLLAGSIHSVPVKYLNEYRLLISVTADADFKPIVSLIPYLGVVAFNEVLPIKISHETILEVKSETN